MKALTLLAILAMPAAAQTVTVASVDSATPATVTASAKADKKAAAEAKKAQLTQPIEIQHIRPFDARGINVFETPKTDNVPFNGFKLQWGAAFTQQYQGLDHLNTADSVATSSTNKANANRLMRIGHGPNNAVANMYLNAQLAKGIRVSMTSYLSARHHQETWVKDGFLLVDDSPIDLKPLNAIMKYTTIRAGHFEINYGDPHFRRTDNGNAMYNPFVGNLLMDAFTTEVGGEVYLRKGPFMVMGGTFGGESRGMITKPQQRSPAFLGKLGFDQKFTPNLRVRLTGSAFSQAKSTNQTLYSGDRGGSRYYLVMENTAATEKDNAWSANVNPGMSSEIHAQVLNPFVKVYGLELFGNIERARGRAFGDTVQIRQFNQNAVEGLYRFWDEKLYVGARYNTVHGNYASNATVKFTDPVNVTRSQIGGGWFLTPTILLKGEYVTQKYLDFPTKDIRNGGKINGFMVEGSVAF